MDERLQLAAVLGIAALVLAATGALTSCLTSESTTEPPSVITIVKSVEVPVPAPVRPCPTASLSAFAEMLAEPEQKPAAADPVPPYVPGLARARLGVMHSKSEANQKLAALSDFVGKTTWGPELQIVRTRSGSDPLVRYRIDARRVSPDSANALCAWLLAHGWDPGSHACEVRK